MTESMPAKEISIRIDGLELKSQAGQRLAKAVQRAVLIEIAQLDLVQANFAVKFPKDWIGIVIRPEIGLQ